MEMTADEAIKLARRQLPGINIRVGAVSACTEKIEPLTNYELSKLPGESCWVSYDLRKEFGFLPSTWAVSFILAARTFGHKVTKSEAEWLNKGATLTDAESWLMMLKSKGGAK